MRRPIDLKNGVGIGQPFAATEFDYSPYGLLGHHGQDYPAPTGQPVYAPEAGTILQSANGVTDPKSSRFAAGETIVMSGSYEHWLMHLSQRLVKAGDRVNEGQLIGYSGNTGLSTGPHLHWGVRPLNPNMNNGYRGFIDPALVLNQVNAPSAGGKIMDTDAKVAAQYNTLRGNPGTALERKAWIGKTYEQFNATAVPEVNARQLNLNNLQKQVADQNTQIGVLNTKVTNLTNQLNTLTAQVNTYKLTIAAKDKEIADLKAQGSVASPADETTVVKNWFSRAFDKIITWNKK